MTFATEDELRLLVERLAKALEPFQRHVDAMSLFSALKHIGRDELQHAREAYRIYKSSEEVGL